jgi:hypothetical protein
MMRSSAHKLAIARSPFDAADDWVALSRIEDQRSRILIFSVSVH